MKFIIDLICAALYRIGGTAKDKQPLPGIDKKGARIIALPSVLALSLAIMNKNFLYIFNALTMQSLRLGDGIPEGSDPGSFLGRIFKKDWLTTGVVQGINSLTCYSIKFYLLHSLGNLIAYTAINVLVAGGLKYFKAKDSIIEPARGACLGLILWI